MKEIKLDENEENPNTFYNDEIVDDFLAEKPDLAAEEEEDTSNW